MAGNGNAIKIMGILIQKDDFLPRGKSAFLDPNAFVLKKSTNPPGIIFFELMKKIDNGLQSNKKQGKIFL
jgi:uncharacterized protein (UPF0218 family)